MRYTSSLRRPPGFARQSPTPRRSVRPPARNRSPAKIVHRTLDRRNRFSYRLLVILGNSLQSALGAIFVIETDSLHRLPRGYPRRFTFCVAHPIRSILTSYLPRCATAEFFDPKLAASGPTVI